MRYSTSALPADLAAGFVLSAPLDFDLDLAILVLS
jgi:hypothetical protein